MLNLNLKVSVNTEVLYMLKISFCAGVILSIILASAIFSRSIQLH